MHVQIIIIMAYKHSPQNMLTHLHPAVSCLARPCHINVTIAGEHLSFFVQRDAMSDELGSLESCALLYRTLLPEEHTYSLLGAFGRAMFLELSSSGDTHF